MVAYQFCIARCAQTACCPCQYATCSTGGQAGSCLPQPPEMLSPVGPESLVPMDLAAWRSCRAGWDGHIMVISAVDQELPALPASAPGGDSAGWRGSIIQQLHSSILANALYGVLAR